MPDDAAITAKPSAGRIVVVVVGVPHPTVGASMVLFFHYVDGLRRAGFEVLNLLLLQPDNASDETLSDYKRLMGEGEDFRVVELRSPHFARNFRWEVSFDHAAVEPARAKVEAFRPDATICLGFATAWATHGWNVGRRVVWLGDLEFETFAYHTRYAWKEGGADAKDMILSLWYSFLWKRRYRQNLGGRDRLIVASKSSETVLAKLGLAATYLPYPWPADPPSEPATDRAATPTFLFFGALQGLGSRSAFHTMVTEIYPGLVDTWGHGGFEILIGGRGGMPDWVAAATGDKPELRYVGFIEDLDAVIARCHAVLAPIDVPVGNRSRILTALSKHAVVVAHRNTALGNPDLVDGETCYLASSRDAFVDRLRRTVEHRDEARRVADRGLALYKRLFAPDVAVPAFVDVVRDAVAAARRTESTKEA